MIDLLVFFWMFVCVNPTLKRTVIYCSVKKHVCNLSFDVNTIFGKTSVFFLGGTLFQTPLAENHLGCGEEDPAFFQLLENHTDENLKLNLVAIFMGI